MEVHMDKHKRQVLLLLSLATIVLLSIVFLSRCTFKVPSDPPTWDVTLIIPLMNDMYTMTDLADDVDEIDTLNQEVVFTIEETLDPIVIGDYLKTDGAEKSTSVFIPLGRTIGYEESVDDTVTMADSIIVESAIIDSGKVWATVNNLTSYRVGAEVEIPSLTRGGGPIQIYFEIPPGQNLDSLSLDGAEFAPGGSNLINFHASITVVGGDGGQGGDVEITVRISDISFKEVTGRFNNVELEIEDERAELNIPDEMEDFRIRWANLKLALWLGFQIPIYTDLSIEAINPASGFPDPIGIQDWIDTPAGPGAMLDTLEFPDDEAVADFINSQPEEILFSGSLRIGKGQNAVTIVDTNTIHPTVIFRAPLTLTLPSDTTETDPDTLEIDDEDTREAIRDNLMGGKIEAVVDNHLPLGMRVSVLFDSTRSDSTLYDPGYDANLTIGPLVLEAAPTEDDPSDPGVKVVSGPETSQLIVELDKDDLRLFEREELYQGTRIEILGTAGEMVRIRPTDYIHVKANLTVQVRTKIPEEDDEGKGGGS